MFPYNRRKHEKVHKRRFGPGPRVLRPPSGGEFRDDRFLPGGRGRPAQLYPGQKVRPAGQLRAGVHGTTTAGAELADPALQRIRPESAVFPAGQGGELPARHRRRVRVPVRVPGLPRCGAGEGGGRAASGPSPGAPRPGGGVCAEVQGRGPDRHHVHVLPLRALALRPAVGDGREAGEPGGAGRGAAPGRAGGAGGAVRAAQRRPAGEAESGPLEAAPVRVPRGREFLQRLPGRNRPYRRPL